MKNLVSSAPAGEQNRRWDVRRSGFPFTADGQLLGTIEAPTQDAAREKAEREFGGRITVRPATQSTEKLEKALAQIVKRRARGARPYAGPRRRPRPMEE